MLMSNNEMMTNINVLEQLNETGKLGYAIARNLRILKEQTTEFRECRDTTIREYGIAVQDTNGITKFKVLPENMEAYIHDMLPIGQIEHDVNVFQIEPEVFFSGSLTSSQMEQLMWMSDDIF